MNNHYRISNDQAEMDIQMIHKFLTESYWAKGVSLETMKKAIANSICFAVICDDKQVGFARMVTDKATFAYLADVFIIDEHRGKGLAKMLMQEIVAHPELQGLRRIVLATRDAHQLYQQFGFTALNQPEIFMEKWNPAVYD